MINNIAFDMDGILVDLMPVIQKHLHLMYDSAGDLVASNEFHLSTSGNLSKNQIWKAIDQAYKDIDSIEAVHGAPTLLSALYFTNKKPIRVVTARPERCRLETQLVLEKLFPKIEFDLRMVTGSEKINELDGIQYFVEDRRRNAINLASHGKTVFLLDRQYNQFDESDNIYIIRVYSLLHLMCHLHRFVKEKAA